MKSLRYLASGLAFAFVFSFLGCKEKPEINLTKYQARNQIEHAQGFELYPYDNFQILRLKSSDNPTEDKQYVLYKNAQNIPDSLQSWEKILIPITNIVVTSTTHISSLVMLDAEETLSGFPGLHYISSPEVRSLIHSGKVAEIGKNERLDTESVIALQPDVLVSFLVTKSNPTLEQIENSGIKVMLNGDWNEQDPLARAEWIKFFGALYDKNALAKDLFSEVKSEYLKLKKLAATAKNKPTVLSGNIFQEVWYLPKGDSWGAQFLADANTHYLWNQSKGQGSLSLNFEEVFTLAHAADFWIGAGSYTDLKQMDQDNLHYKKFKAFQQKKVYTYLSKKGETGGAIYYEEAANRPDIVLKDIIHITHPELLPDHKLYFFEQLQ